MNIPHSEICNPHSLRLGIFGGSFDPVHRGHLLLANCCLEQASLDAVWFVPAAEQPLKPHGPRAGAAHRLAMLRLATENRPEFSVSTIEIDRGGVSYTADTLEAIGKQEPSAELFFLMGADSLAELPKWHRATDICRLALPLIVRRAGSPPPDLDALQPIASTDQILRIQKNQVNMPGMAVSSSQIRQRIATGSDWNKLVTPAVADYLSKHRLYVEAR